MTGSSAYDYSPPKATEEQKQQLRHNKFCSEARLKENSTCTKQEHRERTHRQRWLHQRSLPSSPPPTRMADHCRQPRGGASEVSSLFAHHLTVKLVSRRRRRSRRKQPSRPNAEISVRRAGGTFLEIAYLFVDIRKRLPGKPLSVRYLKRCSWRIGICSLNT